MNTDNKTLRAFCKWHSSMNTRMVPYAEKSYIDFIKNRLRVGDNKTDILNRLSSNIKEMFKVWRQSGSNAIIDGNDWHELAQNFLQSLNRYK